jgi:hypothetical protein
MLSGRLVGGGMRAYGWSAIASLGGGMRDNGVRRDAAWLVSILIEGLLVALVVVAAANLPAAGPMSYVARGTVLLLPPPTRGNTSVKLNGLAGLSDVVITAMTSKQMKARLRADGVRSRYTLSEATSSSGPLVAVTAVGPTRQQAYTDVSRVMKQVPAALAKLQREAGLAPSEWVRSTVITLPRGATPLRQAPKIFGTHWS